MTDRRQAVRDYLASHPMDGRFIAHLADIVGADHQGRDCIGFTLMEDDAWCALILATDDQTVEATLRCVSGHAPQQENRR